MPENSTSALHGRVIRCFLFDLGDTLWWRRDKHVWQAMENVSDQRAAALLRQYVSTDLLPALDNATLGKRLHDAVDKNIRKHIRRDPEIEPDGATTVIRVLRKWGCGEIDTAIGAAIFEALRVRVPGSRPLFDDVLSTLAELQRRGFLLGIVTNRHWGGTPFQEDLRTLGLLNYFDLRHVAVSIDLGIRKPNSAIFLQVLHALDIPPEQAAMVGDSLRSDVLGAQKAGIFSIWKPKPGLREKIYAHKNASLSSTSDAQVYSSITALEAGERSDAVPQSLHITNDEYILAEIESRRGKWDEHMRKDITPNLIIENLSDLLDIFPKAGEQ